jgi:hypothetical protein
MKITRTFALLAIFVSALFGVARAHAASGPPAPTPLTPAAGSQVTVPFTLSWSAVSDPSGIVAYNWEVSPSSNLSPVIEHNSTSGQTQDTVSGLANGTYFWHVQAVSGAFVQGAWSQARSFTVTGANAGEPAAPVLNPINGGTAFHPMESFSFSWSAVPGAATYVVEASMDRNFPSLTEIKDDNIPNTSSSLILGDSIPQGTWYLRVSAVNADRIQGVPSNLDTFTLSFSAPLPPPPTLLTPANGATVPLPVNLTWTDVPNPQESGYVLEIADDSGFKNIEYIDNQITGAHWSVSSLSPGTKFWHVLSTQGDSAPDTPANTAFSATGSFIVPATPPTPVSLTLGSSDTPPGGLTENVQLQLSGPAPAGGAVVNLTSSNPSAAQVPATFTMPAGFGFDQFQFPLGLVTTPTPVTVTATLNGASASVSFTVEPPTLQALTIEPSNTITGGLPDQFGSPPVVAATLNGPAPAGGLVLNLSSNSSAASVPATVTIPAGDTSFPINIATSAVTTATPVTISATMNGNTLQAPLTLEPQQSPTAITLDATVTSGRNGTNATVTLGSPALSDNTWIALSSSNPSVASVPANVLVPKGSTTGGFFVSSTAVTTVTTVTITATGAGVTQSATLTVNPTPPQPLIAPALISPANGARLSFGKTATFTWSDISGAASYTIQVSTSSSFSSTVVNQTVTATQFATSSLPKATLFWRVRANDPAGNPGIWATALSFREN